MGQVLHSQSRLLFRRYSKRVNRVVISTTFKNVNHIPKWVRMWIIIHLIYNFKEPLFFSFSNNVFRFVRNSSVIGQILSWWRIFKFQKNLFSIINYFWTSLVHYRTILFLRVIHLWLILWSNSRLYLIKLLKL